MQLVSNCFLQLLRRELTLLRKRLHSDLLDALVVFGVNNTIFGYLFPIKGGLSGPFMMLGSITIYSLFSVAWEAMMLSNDMTQSKLGPYFVMPISVRWVLAIRPIAWAIHGLLMMSAGLCIGKCILWSTFCLSDIQWLKLLPMMVTVQLLYGFFALWISSLIGGLLHSGWLYPRLINPMFMFSGYYYTWFGLHAKHQVISWLHLVNPVVYCVEGIRNACLGSGYVSAWLCLLALWTFIGFFFWDGTRRFKKKYDLL